MTVTSDAYFDDAFEGQRFMAILRGISPERTVALCQIAWDHGIHIVEVPVQAPSAMPSLEAAIRAGRDRGFEVGAGTVITVEQLRQVKDLGAAFTVAPGTSRAVIEASREAGLPHLPGVATASDITIALSYDHTWLKAFPAAQLGTGWIAAHRSGPFPQVSFVATGGMDASNAQQFLDVGVRVIAVGSALSDPTQLERLAWLS